MIGESTDSPSDENSDLAEDEELDPLAAAGWADITDDPVWGNAHVYNNVVTNWGNTDGTGLKEALDAVTAYNADSNPNPYVILIGNDIAMTASYSLTGTNIVLRKSDGTAYGASWNYSDSYITTKLDTVEGKTNTPITETDSVKTPDLYDGVADFFITGPGGNMVRHFNVSGTAKLTLENVTLKGRANENWDWTSKTPFSDATQYGGGINIANASTLTFAGNIFHCVSNIITDSDGGAIQLLAGTSNLTMNGGTLYHCGAHVGGAIGTTNSTGLITIEGNARIENSYAIAGGGIFPRGGNIKVQGYAVMRGNYSGQGGGAIGMWYAGTHVIQGHALFEDNTALSGPMPAGYSGAGFPGIGGAIQLSYANNTTTLTINEYATFRNNIAARGGGAIVIGNDTTAMASTSLTLTGGEFYGNKALGTYRDANIAAQYKPSIGGGGAIYSYRPERIIIPYGSTVSFHDNEAAFISLTPIPEDGILPVSHTSIFLDDLNYNTHIGDYARLRTENSAMFPAPYDNLYNGRDIGVPNSSPTAFGKFKTQTKAGETLGAGGSVTRTGSFSNVFPAGSEWIGLKVGNPATFTPVPDAGYRFTGWIRSSSSVPLAAEWDAWMTTSQWSANTNNSTSTADPSTNPTVNIKSMGAVDITLTANFEKIPAAELTGFAALNLRADLVGGNYTQPPSENIALTNAVSGTTAASVSLSLSDFEKNGEVWTSPVPFTLTAGNSSITGGTGSDTSWKVQPSGSLTEPGNYTATLTLSYQNGVDAAPVVQNVQISFALIDPDTPLFVLNNIDFGSIVGSSYTVQTDEVYEGEDIKRKRIEINNLSASANLIAITLAGVAADDFSIIPGSPSIPAWGDDDTWQIVPKTGLAPGLHEATIRVGYVASGGGVTISSVAPVKFTVLRPAELSANPSVYSFDTVNPGYIPSLADIVLTNNGEAPGFITGITHKSGDLAFNTINTSGSDEVEVTAGNTSRSLQISPKAGLSQGFYSEVLTITYEHYVAGISEPVTGNIDITATIPVGVSGYIVTANYLDIDGDGELRDYVPVFAESGGTYTPPVANKENFISGGKNYGYYGYKLDGGSIINTSDLPTAIGNINSTHTINYYYGTQDVTVNTGTGGQTPSGSGNYAYGSPVNIGVYSQTGYSFNSFTQDPVSSVTISAPSTTGRRTTASFTAGYGALSVTPVFTPKTYTININSKGGSSVASTEDVATGSHITFESPTRTGGYTFAGYSKTDGGTPVSAYSDFILDAGMISDLFENDTTSVTTLYARWTHPPMTITAITPDEGSSGGGTAVTVTGSYFRPDADTSVVTVKFGGVAASSGDITGYTNSEIIVRTPAHAPGIVSVVIDNGGETAGYGPAADKPGGFTGVWTASADGYEYTAPVSGYINYIDESIDGLTAAANPDAKTWFYTTDAAVAAGTGTWDLLTVPGSGKIALSAVDSEPNDPASSADSKTVWIAYSTQTSAGAPDSDIAALVIRPRPAAPSGLTGGNNLISGGNTTQEYRLSGAGSWSDVTGTSQSTGSSYGDYLVRVKAVNDDPDATPVPVAGNFCSLTADVKVYRPGSISVNGDADVTAFTYPDTFDTKVAVSTVTVTPNEAAPVFYYMAGSVSPEPAVTDGGWTTGRPAIPGEYWVYASVAADTDAAKFYSAATSAVVKVTWNKKLLAVSSGTTFTKTYDGDTSVTLPGGFPSLTKAADSTDVSGQVVYGDTVTVTGPLAIAYAYNSKDAATAGKVTAAASGFSLTGTIAGGGDAADFYTPGTADLEWSASITKATVSVDFSGLTFVKTYDRTSAATPSGALALTGVTGGETVSVTASGVNYFYGTTSSSPTDQASEAANQNVYFSSGDQSKFALSGADSGNYQLTSPLQTTAVTATGWIKRIVVDPEDLIWMIDDVSPAPGSLTVAFDESSHTVSAAVAADKLISGDAVTVPLTGDVTESTVPLTPPYSVNAVNNASGTLNGADGGNYTLSADADQDWAITAALPGAPGTPGGSGSTVTGGTISWLHPTFNGGAELTRYEIQVISYADKGDTLPADFNWETGGTGSLMDDNSITTIDTGTSQAYNVPSGIVTGLNPDLAYAVRVRASNDGISYGPWSENGQLNIDRATPVLMADAIEITYGTSLGNIAANDFVGYVGGFTAEYPSGGSAVDGTWSWSYADDGAKWNTSIDASTIPTVRSPALSFTLLFTPDNDDLYNSQILEAEVVVSQKPLNLDTSALAFSKVYDGTTAANSGKTGNITIDTGQIVSRGDTPDTVTVTDSGVNYVYDNANVGTAHTVSVATDGTVSNLILQGADATNYSISNVTAGTTVSNTGVITAYPLVFSWTLDGTITAEPYQVTYGESVHTMAASATGVSGETVTISTYKNSGTNIAVATDANASASDWYTAQVDTISVNGGAKPSGNYSFSAGTLSSKTLQTWQILKARVPVTWTTGSFTYDKTAKAPAATYTTPGGDTITFDTGITAKAGSAVTAGFAVNAGSYTATALETGNYIPVAAGPQAITQDFTIAPKPLSVDISSVDGASFIYNGENYFAFTETVKPVIDQGAVEPGDVVSIGLGSARWQLSGNIVGTGYDVTVDGIIELSGVSADNYSILVTGAPKADIVPRDKTALIKLCDDITTLDLHKENYTQVALDELYAKLDAANAVIIDDNVFQSQVDAALDALKKAFANMLHEHPVRMHTHNISFGGSDGLTAFGDTVRIEIKGDIRDVKTFALNGKDYPLKSAGPSAYSITENGIVIGTITKGSAVVTLPAAFTDRLENGTHTVVVTFRDSITAGKGTADIVVNRAGSGASGSAGEPVSPKTGDLMNPALWIILGAVALAALLLITARRRKAKGQE